MARVVLMALFSGQCQAAVLPDTFLGTWSPVNHTAVHAILGPVRSDLTMAKDESNGGYWMSVLEGQVFRVKEDLMQYCFFGPGLAEFVVDTVEDNLVRFCLHTGKRMHTQRVLVNGSLATGCDAAKIDLELWDNGLMELTFYMSPPVKHAWAVFERTGAPPPLAHYHAFLFGHDCDPLHPTPHSAGQPEASPCPALNHKRQQLKSALPLVADRKGLACRRYDSAPFVSWTAEKPDIRLQYVIPEKSCWPCNVSYSVSAAIAEEEYIAVGFKGMGADGIRDQSRPNYFGMSADEVDSERTSRAIVLGYAGSSGSCVREMKAEEYVGTPSDVRGNPHLFDESVERVNGRTVVRFTIEQHVGHNDHQISRFFNGFGGTWSARTMWAIGGLDGAGCEAEVQYHRARGLSPLEFFGLNPTCEPDPTELGVQAELEAVSV